MAKKTKKKPVKTKKKQYNLRTPEKIVKDIAAVKRAIGKTPIKKMEIVSKTKLTPRIVVASLRPLIADGEVSMVGAKRGAAYVKGKAPKPKAAPKNGKKKAKR